LNSSAHKQTSVCCVDVAQLLGRHRALGAKVVCTIAAPERCLVLFAAMRVERVLMLFAQRVSRVGVGRELLVFGV